MDLNKTAERVGFEPTVTNKATTVFETVPIGHSGTSPCGGNYTLRIPDSEGIFCSLPKRAHFSFLCMMLAKRVLLMGWWLRISPS